VQVQRRPATGLDTDYCLELHEAAVREVVTAVFGAWDSEVQRRLHEEWFEPGRVEILEVEATPVGVLDVHDRDDHLYLARIEVHPAWQGQGIGSAVVTELIRGPRPVRLDVFAVNVRALALYERLGFAVIDSREGRTTMAYPVPRSGGALNA
jgi:ribosomal protein S18 acetylase RimI-like enzyme